MAIILSFLSLSKSASPGQVLLLLTGDQFARNPGFFLFFPPPSCLALGELSGEQAEKGEREPRRKGWGGNLEWGLAARREVPGRGS